MMDSKQVFEKINRVVVDQYVRKLLTLKIKKLSLYNTLPIIGKADLSNANHLLMFEEPLEIAHLLGPNTEN